ncbi:DUF3332 family protein [Alcanivorax sp. 1008]|uniref:DUF3332 family protein n=1 Tax=Alcanivorax sp. 1008 TaxID=2816853 RepID=UPI001D49BCB3|nr:DUF3332 family protein [Alcanivorax sp. 1008]MCC1495782.1 DUF3332 family protein [Alcanivorax sp. 1008]
MKKLMLPMLISGSVMLSGCLGQNALFNTVQDWNASATDEKFVNQGISFAFWILPVYGLTLLADIVILNSVEFWTGTNPVNNKGAKVAGTTERVKDGLGNEALLTYQADGSVQVEVLRGAQTESFVLARDGSQVMRIQNGERVAVGSLAL